MRRYLDFVVSLLLELGGVDELELLDPLLLAPEAPELGLEELEAPLEGSVMLPDVAPLLIEALPLAEPDAPGVVVLLAEPGVVVSVVADDEELGEDGVVAVGLDDVLLLLVPLLRSQPVTAAVATASTATRGMSLFMTSPFRLRFVV